MCIYRKECLEATICKGCLVDHGKGELSLRGNFRIALAVSGTCGWACLLYKGVKLKQIAWMRKLKKFPLFQWVNALISPIFHVVNVFHLRLMSTFVRFSNVFAWRKDYVIKKFRANKEKVEGSSTFFNRYVKFDQWKCFFFRLTNDVTNNVEMFRALCAKVDTGLYVFHFSSTTRNLRHVKTGCFLQRLSPEGDTFGYEALFWMCN